MVQWADMGGLNDLFGGLGTTTEELERAIDAVIDVADEVAAETKP
jgi:hypothetical protein